MAPPKTLGPNAAFDVDFYLAAKAAQLNDNSPKIPDRQQSTKPFRLPGMNVWEHYELVAVLRKALLPQPTLIPEKYFVEKPG